MRPIFDLFVLPFTLGMIFVLSYCVIGLIRVITQLPKEDRRKLRCSLITPKTIWANIRDLFGDCIFHVKIWKRKSVLGYMHSAIAFGWFMIIIIGHIEMFTFSPIEGMELPVMEKLATNLYFPIFFRYFAPQETGLKAQIYSFLMDFFLLVIISGILIAVIKKSKSKIVGVKRTTKFGFKDNLIRIALWTIFPFRFLAEASTASITNGSFLTAVIGSEWLFRGNFHETLNMIFWWAYSIDLGIFMFVLPFTRYMHIPTEALFILLRNAGLKAKEPRKGFALTQLYSCPGCGLCIDACPMSVSDDKSKNTSAYFIRKLRYGNKEESKYIAETCLMCTKCVEICPVSIDSCDIKLTQRTNIPYKINSDFSYLKNITCDINEIINISIHKGNKDNKILYFAGCMTQLIPKIMIAVTNIMEQIGENYEFLDADGGICCGRPMMLSGKVEEAKALIDKNTELIKKSGAKRLLLSCPICYKVFKDNYNLKDIEIIHHTHYINDLIKKGKLKVEKNDVKYVYHDPCELGRAFGIYEEPRSILKEIGDLKKAECEKELSICCGGSLGSFTLSQKDRDDITTSSLQNLIFNNPEQIVTACPLCLKTFARKSPIEVKDISEVVVENMKS